MKFDFLNSNQVSRDPKELLHYGKDWTTYFDIQARAVVFPESTENVRDLVQWARRERVQLVPSGGRTGLSGGACATQNEVVVSFERMNRILDFDPIDRLVRVQAGVVTETLQKFADEKNLFYPVDFAARGSSHLGGNIATNAGGIRVLRYGMTRQWIAGLQVVTGRGEVLELNRGLTKNATGYDLRHLFIGSEGTLGFVTEALVQLTQKPKSSEVLLLAVPEMNAVMKVFSAFNLSCSLTAFEMFSQAALDKVISNKSLSSPFPQASPFYVILEAEAGEENMKAFEECLKQDWVTDGALAQSAPQAQLFWRYREDISESLAPYSPYKNDISVRISKVPQFMQELETLLQEQYPKWEVIWFGHIGDGNLHINILRPSGLGKEDFVQECRKVDQLVFKCVQKYEGSISAEHGVGLTKKSFLNMARSESEIELMKDLKKLFDPDGIVNPGKIFDGY